jgi:thymidylate kinase
MSKIKLVMFEGADKVGKTTLFRLYRAATHYIPLAIDRFTASNYVYDKYYKRDTSDEEYLRSEIRLQDIFDCYLVVLTASEEELRERIAVNERGSALEVALDNFKAINELFKTYYEEETCYSNAILIDTSKHTILECLQMILDFTGERDRNIYG